jgi:hypothetical protein
VAIKIWTFIAALLKGLLMRKGLVWFPRLGNFSNSHKQNNKLGLLSIGNSSNGITLMTLSAVVHPTGNCKSYLIDKYITL